jgi:hypothetical protein
VATAAFREQRDFLLKRIRHCLPQIPDSLFAESMIPRGVYELACNENKGPSERGVALLDCIESSIEAVPSDFPKIVDILKADGYLESLADALIKSYCKCEGQGNCRPDSACRSFDASLRSALCSYGPTWPGIESWSALVPEGVGILHLTFHVQAHL